MSPSAESTRSKDMKKTTAIIVTGNTLYVVSETRGGSSTTAIARLGVDCNGVITIGTHAEARRSVVSHDRPSVFPVCLPVCLSLTHGLEYGDASVAAPRHRVVANDGVVAGAVEHDASVGVVVHYVVLDRDVVTPLRSDDTVIPCGRTKSKTAGGGEYAEHHSDFKRQSRDVKGKHAEM